MALFYNTYAKLFQRWQGKTLAYNSINYGLNIKNQDKILAAQSYTYGSPSVDYPTPDNPRTLVPLVASGNWCVPCTSSKGGYWCFTLQNDIWEVDGLKDKIKIDMYEGTGYVEQNNWRLVCNDINGTWIKYHVPTSDTKYKGTYIYYISTVYLNKIYSIDEYEIFVNRIFSNRFNIKTYSWNHMRYDIYYYYGQFTDHPTLNNLYFNWKAGSTLEQFKTWIASNPIEVVYHLENPFTYDLTITYSSTVPSGYNILYMDTLVDGVISPENSTPVISLGELYKHSYIVEGESIQPQQVISEVKTDENGVAIIETHARDKTEPIVDMTVEGNVEEKSDWTNTESTESVLDTYIVDTISSVENVDISDKTLTIETYAKDVETKLQKLNIDGNVEEKSDWNSASGLSSQNVYDGVNLLKLSSSDILPDINGITCTIDDNGIFHVSGTTTKSGGRLAWVSNENANIVLPAGQYYFILDDIGYAGGVLGGIFISDKDDNAVIATRGTIGSTIFTLYTTTRVIFGYNVNTDITYDDVQFRPYVVPATYLDHVYEPYTGSSYVRNSLNYLSSNISTSWTKGNILMTLSNTNLGVKVVGNASTTNSVDTAWRFTSPQITNIGDSKTTFYISLYYKTNATNYTNIFNNNTTDTYRVALITNINIYPISSSYTLTNDEAWHNLIIPITVDSGFAWMQVRIGNDVPNLYNSEYIEIQDVMLTESATEIPYLVPSITPSPNPSYPQDVVPAVAAGTYKLPCTQPKGGHWEFSINSDMYGLDDVTKDTLFVDEYSGKIRRLNKCGKLIIRGNNTWSVGSDNRTNVYRYVCLNTEINNTNVYSSAITDLKGLCTHFYRVSVYDDSQGIVFGGVNTYIYLFLLKTDFPDTTAVQTYLETQYNNGTPVIAIYERDISINEYITATWKSTSTATDFPSDKISTITTDLSPDYPRSLVPCNGYENIVTRNLFDQSIHISTTINGLTVAYDPSDDTITINGTRTSNRDHNIKYFILPVLNINNKYSLSINYVSGNIDKTNCITENKYAVWVLGESNDMTYNNGVVNWRSCDLLNTNTYNESKPAYTKFIRKSWFYIDPDITFTNYKVRLQLNIGSTAQPYVKYSNSNISIPLLRAIKDNTSGNIVAKDTFEGRVLINGEWKSRLTRNISEKIFDGTEPLLLQAINSYNICNFQVDLGLGALPLNHNAVGQCSHLSQQRTVIADTSSSGFFLSSERYCYIRLIQTHIQTHDVAGLKVWLDAKHAAGQPLTIWYQLATPVITLGDPIDVNVYPNYTYLYNDSEVQPSLASASYISNKTSIIDSDDVMSPTPEYPCNII